MLLSTLWLSLGLLSIASAADDIQSQRAAFGGVVPAVIPVFEPQGYLHVFYDGIDTGAAQQLAPERLVAQPYIGLNMTKDARAGPPYLLVAIDPDASAIHTSQSCVLHWMISDAYFDDKTGMLSSGFVSAAYARPNPAEASGHHRYIFLLYEQPVLFMPPIFPKQLAGPRLHFNLQAFTNDFLLNSPVAGNYIKSYWTGVEVTLDIEKEEQSQQKPVAIKAHANPWLAGVLGSLLGLMYGASG